MQCKRLKFSASQNFHDNDDAEEDKKEEIERSPRMDKVTEGYDKHFQIMSGSKTSNFKFFIFYSRIC